MRMQHRPLYTCTCLSMTLSKGPHLLRHCTCSQLLCHTCTVEQVVSCTFVKMMVLAGVTRLALRQGDRHKAPYLPGQGNAEQEWDPAYLQRLLHELNEPAPQQLISRLSASPRG